MADRSAWDAHFGSGLKGPYDFTIYMAQFTTDLRYNNGNSYVLLLTGVDEDGEDAEEMLAVGADWESLDGGITLSHPKNLKIINQSSTYAKWCNNAGAACGDNPFLDDKDPLDSRIWVNTKWHLEEKQVNPGWFNKQTNEQVQPRSRLVPVEFLGVVEDDGSVAAVASPPVQREVPSVAQEPSKPSAADLIAAARAQAAQANSAPDLTAPAPTPNGDSPLVTVLTNIANTNDYETFIGLALANDEVLADDVLVESLVDSGPNGFYATHRS